MKNWDDFKSEITSIPADEIKRLEYKAFLVGQLMSKRKEWGWSLRELANKASLQLEEVERIDSAECIPDQSVLERLQKVLSFRYCDHCQGEREISVLERQARYTFRKEQFDITERYAKCLECGNDVTDEELGSETLRKLSQAYEDM